MTRDEAINVFAKEMYERSLPRWDDLDFRERNRWRRNALAVWPVMVDFVAEWMKALAPHAYDVMPSVWRDEMSDFNSDV